MVTEHNRRASLYDERGSREAIHLKGRNVSICCVGKDFV